MAALALVDLLLLSWVTAPDEIAEKPKGIGSNGHCTPTKQGEGDDAFSNRAILLYLDSEMVIFRFNPSLAVSHSTFT